MAVKIDTDIRCRNVDAVVLNSGAQVVEYEHQ
jgi:hypothetical protein